MPHKINGYVLGTIGFISVQVYFSWDADFCCVRNRGETLDKSIKNNQFIQLMILAPMKNQYLQLFHCVVNN